VVKDEARRFRQGCRRDFGFSAGRVPKANGIGGIAAPSPDGRSIAYVTFEPRPQEGRPDLQFWGGTRLWVVSFRGKWEPLGVTQQSPDETYDLRWLDHRTLVFDRVADVMFYKQARIWKAEVTR